MAALYRLALNQTTFNVCNMALVIAEVDFIDVDWYFDGR
jgi:hypothetical protein